MTPAMKGNKRSWMRGKSLWGRQADSSVLARICTKWIGDLLWLYLRADNGRDGGNEEWGAEKHETWAEEVLATVWPRAGIGMHKEGERGDFLQMQTQISELNSWIWLTIGMQTQRRRYDDKSLKVWMRVYSMDYHANLKKYFTWSGKIFRKSANGSN